MVKVLQDIALDKNEKSTARIVAAKTLLEIAGHSPVKTLEIRRPTSLESDYHGKSEEEIRKEIFEGLDDGTSRSLPGPNSSIH
jgi:hypothetical protein